MRTVKRSLFWDLPVPTLECGFQGFLLESHEQKLLTAHHLNQVPQKCKVKPVGTHPETKPSNSPLKSSCFIYFFGFHLCQGNKTTSFFSFTWNLFIQPPGTSLLWGQHPSQGLTPETSKQKQLHFHLNCSFSV